MHYARTHIKNYATLEITDKETTRQAKLRQGTLLLFVSLHPGVWLGKALIQGRRLQSVFTNMASSFVNLLGQKDVFK